MTITISKNGTQIFDGAAAVNVYRLATIVSGLRLEMKGMRLTAKAPSCFSIAKREFGLKGNKAKVLEQMERILHQARSNVEIVASQD